jgi:hypothetical protein
MTAPVVDISSLVPLKWKTWIALAGSVLSFVVPLVVSVEDYLPSPWPAVIGGAIAVLTALGVYRAPYVKPEARIAPDTAAVAAATEAAVGDHTTPWD